MSITFDYVQSRLAAAPIKEANCSATDFLSYVYKMWQIVLRSLFSNEETSAIKEDLGQNEVDCITNPSSPSPIPNLTPSADNVPLVKPELAEESNSEVEKQVEKEMLFAKATGLENEIVNYCRNRPLLKADNERALNPFLDEAIMLRQKISSEYTGTNCLTLSILMLKDFKRQMNEVKAEIRELQADERTLINKASNFLKNPKWNAEEVISGYKILNELKTLKIALHQFEKTSSSEIYIKNLESRLKDNQKELDLKFANAMKRKVETFCRNTLSIQHPKERIEFLRELNELNDDLIKKYQNSSLKPFIKDFESKLKKIQK